MSNRKLALVLVALTALIASGCVASPGGDAGGATPSTPNTSDELIIGIATARSGWMAAYDVPAEQAARLAADHINANGGVNGRQIKVIFADTQTDQQTAATAAQELLAEGAEVILASSDFDYGSPSALAAQSEGRVAISIGAASPLFGLHGIGELAFTVGTPTPTVAAAGAEWAYGEGWKTAIALCDVSIEYSTSLCDSFQESFAAAGGEVVLVENFQQEDTSIAQQLNRIKGTDADFIYLGSYLPGGASAVRQIRSAGIETPIVSGAAMEGTEWLASVPGLSDFYFTSVRFIHGPGESDEVAGFLEDYAAEFGAIPEHSDAVVGYLALELIAAALEANGGDTSGAALAAALNALDAQPTLIGPVSFTDDLGYSLEREMAVVAVDGGEMKFVAHVTPKHVPVPAQ